MRGTAQAPSAAATEPVLYCTVTVHCTEPVERRHGPNLTSCTDTSAMAAGEESSPEEHMKHLAGNKRAIQHD